MARKVIIGVVSAVLLGAIVLFAAEKAQEKKAAEKPGQETKAVGQPEQQEGLLDQLISAYKANDREKMGEIIKKMESRREEMREFGKLNKWHQWAHRREAMMEQRWGQGWRQEGPPCQRQPGPRMNHGFCGEQGRTGGMDGCGPMNRDWQMKRFGPPCCCGGMSGGEQPNRGYGQMRGRDYGPGSRWGPEQNWGPENRPRQMAPPERDMSPGGNVPPPEWGW